MLESRKMRRNMKAPKQGNNKRSRRRKTGEEKKKESQILYFDIFYVDLDSKAELYRGFSLPSTSETGSRAISHECVSRFTLPTDSSRMILLLRRNMSNMSEHTSSRSWLARFARK